MSACNQSSERSGERIAIDKLVGRHRVVATVNDELIAAVEGWRRAHGMAEQSDALGELIRLGLMSEIAKIYSLVTDGRAGGDRKSASNGEGAKARAVGQATNGMRAPRGQRQ